MLNTNTAYYKHTVTPYNEEIHDQGNNQGYSQLWCENTSQRGRSKISSILYAFVQNHCKSLNELTFKCDNCGGQNKN